MDEVMWLMIFGLALFSGVHLFPAMASSTRANLVDKLGLWPFKGLFTVLTVLSIVIIVLGWRSMEPVSVYGPPLWGRYATYLLVLLTFILFVAPFVKTNIRRILRHPQLCGIVLWSIGHLLANGDSRSLVLFIWVALWAILEMIMINRREGVWKKSDTVSVKNDVITVIGGCILYVVLLLAHPYLSGSKLI
jgi:uncharacterized membrane protein